MMNLISFLEVAQTPCTIGNTEINIPSGIFSIVSLIIKLIQVAVPILLIIWGMIDFAKAVVGGDEDKIKAGQKLFIKRLIAGVIVFLVVTIVMLLLNLVGTINGEDGINNSNCITKFINGPDA